MSEASSMAPSRRAPASVSGLSDAGDRIGSGGDDFERALEVSSRAGVREQAALRALGGGNLLYDPLGVFLAGERAVWCARSGALQESTARHADDADPGRRDPDDGCALLDASAVKHRVIDDIILRECCARDGIKQVVLLNAGFGTRPYRLRVPNVTWFEVDTAEVLMCKRGLVRSAGGTFNRSETAASRSNDGAGRTATTTTTTTAYTHVLSSGGSNYPFAFMATHSAKDVRAVCLDAAAAAAAGAARDGRGNRENPLRDALVRSGFDLTQPCVFVVEDLLKELETKDARFLLKLIPKPRGSVLVCAGIPKRVVTRARRAAARQATPEGARLAELSSRWRSDLESATAKLGFPFVTGGWRASHSRSLREHARAYGYAVSSESWRPDEERVAEFRRLPRGFLGVPGFPGSVFFPIKMTTLVRCVPFPFVHVFPVLRRFRRFGEVPPEASNRGPPATSRVGALGGFARTIRPTAIGSSFAGRAVVSATDPGAGPVASFVDGVFASALGRALALALAAAAGRAYGDRAAAETRMAAVAIREAAKETAKRGKSICARTVTPVLDEKVLPFLNAHVASRLPGDVTFSRGGSTRRGEKGRRLADPNGAAGDRRRRRAETK